jgi:hypothetical protein
MKKYYKSGSENITYYNPVSPSSLMDWETSDGFVVNVDYQTGAREYFATEIIGHKKLWVLKLVNSEEIEVNCAYIVSIKPVQFTSVTSNITAWSNHDQEVPEGKHLARTIIYVARRDQIVNVVNGYKHTQQEIAMQKDYLF